MQPKIPESTPRAPTATSRYTNGRIRLTATQALELFDLLEDEIERRVRLRGELRVDGVAAAIPVYNRRIATLRAIRNEVDRLIDFKGWTD